MKNGIDLKVQRNKDLGGLYDLIIDEFGQLALVDNFDTSLQMSVYCERRADGSEVLPPENRRGWWGNTISNFDSFEIGSKIWILYQSRLDQNILNKLVTYAQEGFQWLLDYNYLYNFNVDAQIIEEVTVDARIVQQSKVQLNLTLYRSPNEVETKYFVLWDNTVTYELQSL